MKKLFEIPEKTVQKWVYLTTIPLAIVSGICAAIFAALLQQGPALMLFKVFASAVSFIAIYSLVVSEVFKWKKENGDE